MRREYKQHRAKIIVFAYVLPFLAVALALYAYQEQRDTRRAQAVTAFSEARAAVLYNCEQIEVVKKQLRLSLIEAKSKAKNDLKAVKDDPKLYPMLKSQLDRGLVQQNKLIARFAPVNCKTLPFVNRGKTPYPPG